MILFIRDKNNHTIVDLEVYVKKDYETESQYVELHVSIDIEYYSKFLLENLERQDEIIKSFSDIDELRGWLWESYFMGRQNNKDEYDDVLKILKERLKRVAKLFNLYYVED